MKQRNMKIVRMTIKTHWMNEIKSRRKKWEYRENKPFWRSRIKKAPFILELIAGYRPDAKRLQVLIDRVVKTRSNFELHIKKVFRKKIKIAKNKSK
jgi:hypothetical protein